MSREKNEFEAKRWLVTAESDLASAQILFDNGQYAHSCFHAQQCGEKAVKALWYKLDADPWGHSIKKLIDELEEVDTSSYEHMKKMSRSGVVLDRFYIPTRYPNGLPDITPDVAFYAEDAKTALDLSQSILDLVKSLL